jgi:hypothetical protein
MVDSTESRKVEKWAEQMVVEKESRMDKKLVGLTDQRSGGKKEQLLAGKKVLSTVDRMVPQPVVELVRR